MKNKLIVTAVLATMFFAVANSAEAVTRFRAIIENEQEVANPLVPEQGSGGIGFFELNDAMNALSYDITLFGLDIDGLQTPGNVDDDATRFSIHAAQAGQNGGTVFGMKDPNHDLDDLVINAATGRITGVWDGAEGNFGITLGDQVPNLLADGLYFKVHTPDYPGGEVRGQILLIPEPAGWVLCLLGLASLRLRNRRPE
jgi:CHRD domain